MRLLRFLLPFVAVVPSLLAEPPKAAPQLTFVRGKEGPNKISSLETLSAEYKPANGKGPSVWLIGVAHMGTAEYYAGIQKRLDAQGAVLYEGVGGEKLQQGAKSDTSKGIQGQLSNALGLVFQLDAIDYQRPHFINSDFTAADLEKAIANRSNGQPSTPAAGANPDAGKPATDPDPAKPADAPAATPKVDNQTFESMMDALHGEGEMAESLGAMVSMMGSSPEMRETTKLMLIEALGQAGELITLAKSMSPELKDLFEVLITERNEHVIRQLDAQLKKPSNDKSIAIFYGAAHMDEIAERLTKELHYVPGAQQWDAAFTANGAKSLMPPSQIKMMIQMVRLQLQAPAPASSGNGAGNALPLLNLFGPATPSEPAKK